MKKLFTLAMITLLGVPLGGCGTILNFAGQGHGFEDVGKKNIYGGIQNDFIPLSHAETPCEKIGAIALIIIDLPLSLVMDTVTLPITIPIALIRSPERGIENQPTK